MNKLAIYKTNDAWKIVYDKVCNLEKEYAQKNNMESVNDCIRLENLLQYFKEELRSTEEYKGGWIPCSEKTPLETGYYLVTIKGYNRAMYAWWINTERKWQYLNSQKEIKEVIAWQPLPQIYQPKGE